MIYLNNKLKVLELFAGIGACSKALTNLGIEHEIVDAVEIDKYAVKSFNAIHGTNFEPQDITKWDKDIECDLIMHGSPCQDFSIAGKQAGGDEGSGTRSSLLYETLRIVAKLKPKYVVWENVKNVLSQKHRHNFDNYLKEMEDLGYTNYYQVLNAKDYGIPQNRERVFTVSILKEINNNIITDAVFPEEERPKGNYLPRERAISDKGIFRAITTSESQMPYISITNEFNFPPKQELKLRLKDILEDEVKEKYYLSDEVINKLKSYGYEQSLRLENLYGNCNTINTMQGGHREPKIAIKNATKKGYTEATDGDGIDLAYPESETRRGRVQKQKAHTITTSDNLGVLEIDNSVKPSVAVNFEREKKQINESEKDIYQAKSDSGWQDNKVGLKISPTLRANNNNTFANTGYKIRKLTPLECWRLMGFDDEDFEKASQVNSNSQLYKQAGNSIVVNVLMEIFKELIL